MVAELVTGTGRFCPFSTAPLRFALEVLFPQRPQVVEWTTDRLAHMPTTSARCVNCQNFHGCQRGSGICRVWQALLPIQVASSNRCEHWTAASVR